MTTIKALHKMLGHMISAGHGRKGVCINKSTFKDARESDGLTIIGVRYAEIQTVPLLDDDGATAERKDGSERTMTVLVLSGDHG